MTFPSALQKLERWYLAQCNGEWEHNYGVTIGTLDNPGWTLDVDLVDTDLFRKPFDTIATDSNDKDRWIHCSVQEGKFKAACAPMKLEAIIEIFLAWSEEV